MVVGRQDHAGLLAGGNHRLCVLDASGERFLAQDMDARFSRSERCMGMSFVGRGHVYRVVSRGEEILETGHRECNAELLGVGAPAGRVGAHYRNNFAAGLVNSADHPLAPNDRRADQSATNRWHALPLPLSCFRVGSFEAHDFYDVCPAR